MNESERSEKETLRDWIIDKSNVNGVRFFGENVGAWGTRSAADEVHDRTKRYPEALMPVVGVRVRDLTVSLTLEVANDPKASEVARILFDNCFHAVEVVLAGGNADVVGSGEDDNLGDDGGHGSSPLNDAHDADSRDVFGASVEDTPLGHAITAVRGDVNVLAGDAADLPSGEALVRRLWGLVFRAQTLLSELQIAGVSS